jgi:hypothetical protein
MSKNKLDVLTTLKPHVLQYTPSGMPLLDIEATLPKEGFIPVYINHLNDFSDAPIQFKAMTAIQVASIAIGHKIVFTWAGKPKWVNLFSLLVGPPVFTRKSHITGIGRETLKSVNILPLGTDFTAEGIVTRLDQLVKEGKDPSGFLYFTEFSQFIKSAQKSYNTGNIEFLNQLYDCDDIVRVRSGKDALIVKNPVVSMLACSTPSWIRESVNEGDIGGGFWARILIIPADEPRPNEIKTWPDIKKNAINEEKAKYHLWSFVDRKGAISFGERCKEIYNNWHHKVMAEYQEAENKNVISSFTGRILENQLKLACIFTITQQKPDEPKIVDPLSMIYACRFSDYLWESMKYLFSEVFANQTPYQRDKKKIEDFLMSYPHPDIPRRDIQQRASKWGIRAYRLDEIRDDLEVTGVIKVTSSGSRGGEIWMLGDNV